MSKRKLARKSAPVRVTETSRASSSVKNIDGTKQLIWITIVAVAAIIFFGYVLVTSAAKSESKVQRDSNIMERVQSGEIKEIGPSSIPDFPERVKGHL